MGHFRASSWGAQRVLLWAWLLVCTLLPAREAVHSSAPTNAPPAGAWRGRTLAPGFSLAHIQTSLCTTRQMASCARIGVLRGGEAPGGADEACGAVASKEARMHRDEGDRLYKGAKYEQAVEAYTAALQADCSVEGAFGGRAAALLMTSQYGAVCAHVNHYMPHPNFHACTHDNHSFTCQCAHVTCDRCPSLSLSDSLSLCLDLSRFVSLSPSVSCLLSHSFPLRPALLICLSLFPSFSLSVSVCLSRCVSFARTLSRARALAPSLSL